MIKPTLIIVAVVVAQAAIVTPAPQLKVGATTAAIPIFNSQPIITISNNIVNTSDFGSFGVSQSGVSVNSISSAGKVVSSLTTSSADAAGNNSNNFYLPSTPSQSQSNTSASNIADAASATPTTAGPVSLGLSQTEASCKNFAFTYWTGSRCACRVGYRMDQGFTRCIKISLTIPTIPTNPSSSCKKNQVFSFTNCICANGFVRNIYGECVADTTISCPVNSHIVGKECICDDGYIKQGTLCLKKQTICGQNMYYNGLICVCNAGFVPAGDKCVKQNVCPANSQLVNGVCKCMKDFVQVKPGVCSRCDQGAVFLNGKCEYTCGVNEEYNTTTKACQCKANFGILNGVCSTCNGQFFLKDGYCVQCSADSTYSQETKSCECDNGIELITGLCLPNCNIDQVFDQTLSSCRCSEGLGLLQDGSCGECPTNNIPDPTTQQCVVSCKDGQTLQNGQCVCQGTFGIDLQGNCADCLTINSILHDGFCVQCTNDKIFSNGACICKDGQSEVDGVCQSLCAADQLIDASGNCYNCQVHEIIVSGNCVCEDQYVKDDTTQICTLSCPDGFININEACGVCQLGTVFNPDTMSCQCPPGTYSPSEGSPCVPVTLPPTVCPDGQFSNDKSVCTPCAANCAICTGLKDCTKCKGTLNLVNGQCFESGIIIQQTTCGNGVPNANEQCDDGNLVSGDGCSKTCFVEPDYSCTQASISQPSKCSKKQIATSWGMKTASEPLVNPKNVFISLTLEKSFTFTDNSEMLNFIQYDFPAEYKPISGYCRQKESGSTSWSCLFNYLNSPAASFTTNLSFNKNGDNGFLPVLVDPKKTTFKSRRY